MKQYQSGYSVQSLHKKFTKPSTNLSSNNLNNDYPNQYTPGMYTAPESLKPPVKNSRPFSARESLTSASRSNVKHYRICNDNPVQKEADRHIPDSVGKSVTLHNQIDDIKMQTQENLKKIRCNFDAISNSNNINIDKLIKPVYSVKKGIVQIVNNGNNNNNTIGSRAMSSRKNDRPITKVTLEKLKEDANFMNINEMVRRNKIYIDSRQINRIFSVEED